MEKESKSIGLEKKDAIRIERDGEWEYREIAAEVNPATPVYKDKLG